MISTIVIASIVFQTAVSLYLLNSKKLRDDFEKYINVLLIILFFHLATKFFLLAVLKNPFLYNRIVTGFGLAYGPILYLAMGAYLHRPVKPKTRVLHLLPFFAFTVVYVIHVIGYLSGKITESYILRYTNYYQWLVAISLITYPISIRINLHKSQDRLASMVGARGSLLKGIALILLVGTLSGIMLAFTHLIRVPIANFDLRVAPYLCFALIPIWILRYKLYNPVQPETNLDEFSAERIGLPTGPALEQQVRHYRKSALDELMMNEYEFALRDHMDKSKLFLNAEISLEDLSKETKIPKHHLTQLLNERFKQNFYSFINEYRIREAVKALENPAKEVNILSLAYDCGFNSKSSFNKYFKKLTDHTPSSYRKKAFGNPPSPQ
jgi:AraC-like DNA-binding protein